MSWVDIRLFNAALNSIHPVIIFRKATRYCSPNLEVGLCLIIKVGNTNENLSALRWDHRRSFILVNVPGHVCGAATRDIYLSSLQLLYKHFFFYGTDECAAGCFENCSSKVFEHWLKKQAARFVFFFSHV